MQHAIETVHPTITQREHELTIAQPPKSIWLRADVSRLQQTVVNLLVNTAKYTHPGGHIWVTLEQEGNHRRQRLGGMLNYYYRAAARGSR